MEPEHFRFGGGSAVTLLHPLVALATIFAVILILCLPRKYVIAPVLLALFFTPKGQVIIAAGLHFNVYRIIILAGLARWAVSRRSSPLVGGFNFMDRVFTLWAVSTLIVFSLQWLNMQALIKSLGDFLDTLGGYFLIRFLIRDREDIRRTIEVLATIAIVCAVCMLNEQRTGQNIFGILGGVLPETIRGGKIRSQGPFEVYILAGTYGATLVPLVVWLSSETKSRIVAFLGIVGATIMTLTCHATTTLGAYGAGIFALCLWPIRKGMRLVRWGIVATLVGLHIVMKGPVWSLIEHIDLTGSSESYHRYQLVDTFIRHFSDWWLLGTRSNGSWGWEMVDTSNQYVSTGIQGGLVCLVLFIAIISRGFGALGTARKHIENNRSEEWFLWCLGASMFAHVVAYFGIGYFDQMQYAWYCLLAIISVAFFEDMTSPAMHIEEALGFNDRAHAPSRWRAALPQGREVPYKRNLQKTQRVKPVLNTHG